MAIFPEQRKEIIKAFQQVKANKEKNEKDCGSSEVQIALLTERIKNLTEHLKISTKDFSARRGLMMMVGKRSALLRYLKGDNPESYKSIVERLGIRK